jgi:hypothetical protein
MCYPQLAGRNLHYLSWGPCWLGECADCNVSTPFFILGVIDARKFSPVPCSFTSSIAIRTKTSLSMCLQITRRWYDYCLSTETKVPDRHPKSCSTIGLVSKRKSSSSASTKTTLTRSRGCQKMRSAYGYAAETSSMRDKSHVKS